MELAEGSVCGCLREDILSGVFPFGSRLKIDEIAARYITSHMPIREALRQLHGEGLVNVERNRGARVRAVDVEFVRDMFDLRIALESMLARRAAERIGSTQLEKIYGIQSELEASAARADYAAALAANQAFHAVINEAAGNIAAIRILDRHWNIIVALWGQYGYGEERVAGLISDHRQIAVALSQRDSEGAAIIAAAHAAKAKQAMLSRICPAGIKIQ